MSYTPTEWKSGDVVTSAKLNKLEEGVASSGGALIATLTQTLDGEEWINNGCDKTLDELKAAMESGVPIIFKNDISSSDTIDIKYFWATSLYGNAESTIDMTGIHSSYNPRGYSANVMIVHLAFYSDGTMTWEMLTPSS